MNTTLMIFATIGIVITAIVVIFLLFGAGIIIYDEIKYHSKKRRGQRDIYTDRPTGYRGQVGMPGRKARK